MRPFLLLSTSAAVLVFASCSPKTRVYPTGGGGSGTVSSSSTAATAGGGGTGGGNARTSASSSAGAGGKPTSTRSSSSVVQSSTTGTSTTSASSSSTSSGACVAKTCKQLKLDCGVVSDGCADGGTVDCGYCPSAQVCGTETPNMCGTSAACTSYTANVCTQYNQCAPDVLTSLYGTIAECERRYALFCALLVSYPDTSWTEARAKTCGSALAGLSCDSFLLAPFNGGPTSCQPTPGLRANGANCVDSGQCSSAYCQHVATSLCGTCAARAPVGSGCRTVADCESGLACVSGVCAVALTTGKACTTGAMQCAVGEYCQAGTCQPPIALNGACTAAGAVCNDLVGLYCSTTSHTCVADVGYAAAGGTCGVIGSPAGVEGCSAAGTCDETTLTCVAAAADGAACGVATHVGCTNPAVCFGGVCALATPSTCP